MRTRSQAIAVALSLMAIQTLVRAQDPPNAPYRKLDDIRISLQRTACFGECPIYSVTIEGNGSVVYTGVDFVASTGVRETTIGDDDLVKLVNEFLRVHFFDANEEYRERSAISIRPGRTYLAMSENVSDNPSTLLSLKLGDRTKTVTLYYNYPAELSALADLIDEVSGAKRWSTTAVP